MSSKLCSIVSYLVEIHVTQAEYQNPRETSSWSRIFIISLVYLCMYLFMCVFIYLCHVSCPTEKRYRPEIRHTYSHCWSNLKMGFCFFEKILMTAASLEKLPCHVDLPHISSIALLIIFFIILSSYFFKFINYFSDFIFSLMLLLFFFLSYFYL